MQGTEGASHKEPKEKQKRERRKARKEKRRTSPRQTNLIAFPKCNTKKETRGRVKFEGAQVEISTPIVASQKRGEHQRRSERGKISISTSADRSEKTHWKTRDGRERHPAMPERRTRRHAPLSRGEHQAGRHAPSGRSSPM